MPPANTELAAALHKRMKDWPDAMRAEWEILSHHGHKWLCGAFPERSPQDLLSEARFYAAALLQDEADFGESEQLAIMRAQVQEDAELDELKRYEMQKQRASKLARGRAA